MLIPIIWVALYHTEGNFGGGKFWRMAYQFAFGGKKIGECTRIARALPDNYGYIVMSVSRVGYETMTVFCFDSKVRGYHEYQGIWLNPYIGEKLIGEREVGNSHDPQAVAIKKEIDSEFQVVGHVPIVVLFHFYSEGWKYQVFDNRK